MTTKDTDWQASARRQTARQRAAWMGTIAAGVAAGLLGGIGLSSDAGVTRTVLIAAAIAFLLVSLVWGTFIYMRVIDEQERDANLWACYVGMVAYLALYVTKSVAEKLAIDVPISETGIFIVTMAIVLAVFVKRRFG